MAFHPRDGSICFAQSYDNGLHASTNANLGASSTWSLISSLSGIWNGYPCPKTVSFMAISISGALWCVDYGGTGGGDVWSYSGGTSGTWTNHLSDGQSACLACDPNDGSHVVAAQSGASGGASGLNEYFGIGFGGWSRYKPLITDIPWIRGHIPYELGAVGLFFDRNTPGKLYANANQDFWNITFSGSITPRTTVTWTSQGVGIEELVANQIVVTSAGIRTASWDFRDFMPVTYAVRDNTRASGHVGDLRVLVDG